MVGLSAGKFRCIIQTPTGSLLDCRTGLVVLPAHDGMRGILHSLYFNHNFCSETAGGFDIHYSSIKPRAKRSLSS